MNSKFEDSIIWKYLGIPHDTNVATVCSFGCVTKFHYNKWKNSVVSVWFRFGHNIHLLAGLARDVELSQSIASPEHVRSAEGHDDLLSLKYVSHRNEAKVLVSAFWAAVWDCISLSWCVPSCKLF